MQYLILGADGYIGSYLYKRLKEDGVCAAGTKHSGNDNNELIYFDVADGDIEMVISEMPCGQKTAVVCVAESNIDKCYTDYDAAYRINVILTKSLIHKLKQAGFRIIFFSSDNVFDGYHGNYTEESKTSAINEYGKMKAEMEEYLLAEGSDDVCIFRLSKVVDTTRGRKNILTEWETGIDSGLIKCIKDNILSFVYIEDIYQICRIAAENKLSGLYNITCDHAYKRDEIARKFCNMAGKDAAVVKECEIEELLFKDVRRPLNVSMSNQKIIRDTRYRFKSVEYILKKYIQDNHIN